MEWAPRLRLNTHVISERIHHDMSDTNGVSRWLKEIDKRITSIDWGNEIALALIPLDILHADPVLQRTTETPKGRENIENIKRDFNPIKFDPITVNIRENMELSVVDGQHRVVAMRELGRGHQVFPAMVSFGQTLSEEANRFWTQDDNTKPVTLIEKFRTKQSDVTQHQARSIAAVLSEYGYEVKSSSAPGTLRCIASIEAVYGNHGEGLLRAVLVVLSEAWGSDVGRVDNRLFRGLARFITHYGHAVDPNRLTRTLRRSSARQVQETAAGMATGVGTDHMTSTVNAIRTLYDFRQSPAHRLPPFMHRTSFDLDAWVARRSQ